MLIDSCKKLLDGNRFLGATNIMLCSRKSHSVTFLTDTRCPAPFIPLVDIKISVNAVPGNRSTGFS